MNCSEFSCLHLPMSLQEHWEYRHALVWLLHGDSNSGSRHFTARTLPTGPSSLELWSGLRTDFPFGPNRLRLWHCGDFTFDSAAHGVLPEPASRTLQLHELHRARLPVSKLGKVS